MPLCVAVRQAVTPAALQALHRLIQVDCPSRVALGVGYGRLGHGSPGATQGSLTPLLSRAAAARPCSRSREALRSTAGALQHQRFLTRGHGVPVRHSETAKKEADTMK